MALLAGRPRCIMTPLTLAAQAPARMASAENRGRYEVNAKSNGPDGATKRGGKRSAGRDAPKPAAPERDETDSFIAEVSEELRRDRLFAMFRRFGPYAIAFIVLLVGGAAVNEYMKSAATAEARRVGEELIEASRSDEPASAYLSVAAEAEPNAAMLANLRAAELRAERGDAATAATIYRSIAVNPELPARFRDLALLRAAMVEVETADPNALIDEMASLTAQDAPYRSLALEVQAGAYLRLGDGDAAREALEEARASPNATRNLIGRVNRLLEALGGGAEPGETADAAAPETE